VRVSEIAQLEAVLTPAQRALFGQMARSDQRHSLDVMHTLRQAGHQDRDLLQAALLHDAGKSVPARAKPSTGRGPLQRLTVWHRTAVVLMQNVTPGWLARLAADGRGWKRPFAIHVQHAQTSAQLAAQAGCTPKVVALIREHHAQRANGASAPNKEQAALLQWADEQN
jgi:putative nucleotidyltransferase with HDIG domain